MYGGTIVGPGRIQYLNRAVAALAAVTVALAQTSRPDEDQRAALLLGLARFSEWPAARGHGLPQGARVAICVLQQAGVTDALERAVAGRPIQGRPVVVRPIRGAGQAAGCHILYLGRTPGARLAEALHEAPATALTVGEDETFLAAGGAVRLFDEDGHVSFEVNLPALQTAGVSISSKMLRLGHTQRVPARRKAAP